MKAATKKDLVGKVANNPRYDGECRFESGWDGKIIEKAKEKNL